MRVLFSVFVLSSFISLGFIIGGCSNSNPENNQETGTTDTTEMEDMESVDIDSESLGINEFEEGAALEGLGWLLGNWTGKSRGSKQHENWSRLSNEVMQGNGHTVVNGDTTFSETMRIEQFGDDIFYTVKVAQNEYPISFKLISITDEGVQFENLEHDFPNQITYHLNGKNLLVTIEGKGRGARTSVAFNFTRNN